MPRTPSRIPHRIPPFLVPLLPAVVATAGLVACSGETLDAVLPPLRPAPTVDAFTADADTVRAGEPTTLRWSGVPAQTVATLEPGARDVSTVRSAEVAPVATTEYVLTVANDGGSNRYALTVTVLAADKPAPPEREPAPTDDEPAPPGEEPAPGNRAPVAQALERTLPEGGSAALQLLATDPDGDALVFAITAPPQNGVLSDVDATAGTATYTPDDGYAGPDAFAFTASDGERTSAEATVAVAVVEVTTPEVGAFFQSATILERGEAVTFSWEVSSGDGDPVSCTLDAGDGTLYEIADCLSTTSQSHSYGVDGSYPVTLTASDDDGAATSEIYVTAATYDSSGFDIHVVFDDDSLDPEYQAAFESAAARWAEVITDDLAAVTGAYVGCSAGGETFVLRGDVDDLVIIARGPAIDGAGGTLGAAAFCRTRSSGSLPWFGIMMFDIADIASLAASDDLEEVILHEMGHVLGISKTGWGNFGLVDTAAHTYSGTRGVAEYGTLEGSAQTTVPVEDGGGSGTMNSHWEDSVFYNELMTGYLNSGIDNPLSRLTVATLDDMGYTVDYDAADVYALPSGSLLRAPAPEIELHTDMEVVPVDVED